MKQIKKYLLSFGLFFALFAITFFFIFSSYSLNDFLNSLKQCNPKDIFLSFLCVLLYLIFGVLFLKNIMKELNHPITTLRALCYNCIEIYFSAITPSSTGGQPAEIYCMDRDGIPLEKSTIVIFINTILYKLVIVILLVLAIILFPRQTFQHGWIFIGLMFLGMFLNILAVFFFSCLLFSETLPKRILNGCISLLFKLHLLSSKKKTKLNHWSEKTLKEYQAHSKFLKKNPHLLIKSFLLLLIQRLCLFSISYFIYHSFGLREFNYLQILFLQIAITSAVDSVPSPGGVMVGEGLTYQINAFIYGESLAVSSMLLVRGISFYFLVFFCSLFFLYHHFIGKNKKQKNKERGKM